MENFPFAREIQYLSENERQALFYGFCGKEGEEKYTELVLSKSWMYNGEKYILVQNLSEDTKSIQLFTEGSTVKQLIGEGAALTDNHISVKASPKTVCFFKVQTEEEMGLYDGNVSLGHLREGTFTLRGAKQAVLYQLTDSGTMEMLRLWQGEEVIINTVKPGYLLKLYRWDDALVPIEKSCVLYKLDF